MTMKLIRAVLSGDVPGNTAFFHDFILTIKKLSININILIKHIYKI